MSQTLPDYLAGRRRLYNFTRETVAAKVGVTRQTLASWEEGKTSPEIDKAQLWIQALPLTDTEKADVAALLVG